MEETLVTRLTNATLHVRKAASVLTGRLEANMMELVAMRHLCENRLDASNNVFAQDLAIQLHASKATVSQMLTSLEDRGYVARAFNPENRRKIIFTLTDKGMCMLADTQAEFIRLMQSVIREFGEDEALQLADSFERFMAIIERQAAQNETSKGR